MYRALALAAGVLVAVPGLSSADPGADIDAVLVGAMVPTYAQRMEITIEHRFDDRILARPQSVMAAVIAGRIPWDIASYQLGVLRARWEASAEDLMRLNALTMGLRRGPPAREVVDPGAAWHYFLEVIPQDHLFRLGPAETDAFIRGSVDRIDGDSELARWRAMFSHKVAGDALGADQRGMQTRRGAWAWSSTGWSIVEMGGSAWRKRIAIGKVASYADM